MKKLLGYLTVYDKLLIGFVIAVSFIWIIVPVYSTIIGNNSQQRDEEKEIVIEARRGEQQRIPLADTYGDQPLIVEVEGPIGTSVIEAHQGRVRLKQAPEADPHKICEKTGWIEEEGPSIICVPNQISIKIESAESDLDGTTW